MNREEQIQRASEQYPLEKVLLGSVLLAFRDGALWADAHPKEDGVEMWLSRHKNGRHLRLHFDEPIKCNKFFYDSKPLPEENQIYLPEDMFPEVTFENSPRRIRITLIKE